MPENLQLRLNEILGLQNKPEDEWLYDYIFNQLSKGKSNLTIQSLRDAVGNYEKASPIKRLFYKTIAPSVLNKSNEFNNAISQLPQLKQSVLNSVKQGPVKYTNPGIPSRFELPDVASGPNYINTFNPDQMSRMMDIFLTLEQGKGKIPNLLRGIFERKQEVPFVTSRISYE